MQAHSHDDGHSRKQGQNRGLEHGSAGHSHSQPEGHDHGPGHSHVPQVPHGYEARQQHKKRLLIVLGLSSVYMVAEGVGGMLTGSLALLADAGHLLSDVASLVLGLFAIWVAQRPASAQRTFGHTRVEILAALAQGVALVAVSMMIFIKAVERLGVDSAPNGLGMMGIAAGALVINGAGLLVLNRGRSESINIRGVWLHVASDALGSLGVIFAGAAIWLFGAYWADAAVSMLISVLVLFAAWQLLRDAVDILMEAAPQHLDVQEIRSALAGLPGVESVHDLHVWTIGNGEISLSSHLVAPRSDGPGVLVAARSLLSERFEIHHSTVQVELEATPGEECDDGAIHP